jgi:hemoglobin
MSQEAIYAEVGGRDTVEAVVDDFDDHVLDDPLLEPYFEGTDLDALFARCSSASISARVRPAGS